MLYFRDVAYTILLTVPTSVPPNYMIEMGKNSKNYFHRYTDEYGQKRYRFKHMEEYNLEQSKDEQPSKCYFSGTTLPEIINSYPMPRRSSFSEKERSRGK